MISDSLVRHISYFLILLLLSASITFNSFSQESSEELKSKIESLLIQNSLDLNSESFEIISNELFEYEDTTIARIFEASVYQIESNDNLDVLQSISTEWLKTSIENNKVITSKSIATFLSNTHFENAAYDSALYYIGIADSLFQYDEEFDNWGELYLLKAAVYDAKGEFIESIESVFEAIDKFEQGELNEKQLAFSYLQIGSTYLYLNMLEKANRYYKLAENYFDDLEDTLGAAITRSNMALVEFENKNYTKSIVLLKGALDEISSSGRHTIYSYALQSLTENFLEINELDSATYYLAKSSRLNNRYNYQFGIGLDNYLYACLYLKKNKSDSLIFYGEKAYEILKKDQDYDLLSKLTLLLANQYKKNRLYDKSIFYFEKNNSVVKKLSEENQRITQLLQVENANLEKTKYELKLFKEKKRLHDFEHEREEERFLRASIIAGIAIALLILSLYFLYQNRILTRKLKTQKDLITKELEVKRSLLGEIHHRVKNNLQIISSMLSIQSQYIKDDRLDHVIRECRNRIVSMSLIHESLYKRESEDKSIFSQYIKKLIPQLIETYQIEEGKIKLNLDIEEFELSLDDSIPCGLIINEIVSNSLKHGFKGKEDGVISLSMKRINNMIEVHVGDNGIGLKTSIIPEEHDSFGFLLINSLIRQLGAKLEVNTNNGLSYTFRWRSHSDKLLS